MSKVKTWEDNPDLKRACKTCEGTGVVVFDCREDNHCMSGGRGGQAAHELECPCCEGSGGQP
jgi:hypothetical protein